MSDQDSAMRIEIGLRAAMIAKAALEMLNMNPHVALLQLNEVAGMVLESEKAIKAKLGRPK